MPQTRYKDLAFDLTERRGALNGGPSIVEGPALLEHRLVHRLSAGTGTLTHRPEYGANLPHSVGYTANPQNLGEIGKRARLAALEEADVLAAQARVTVDGGVIIVELAVTKRGESQPQTVVLRMNE